MLSDSVIALHTAARPGSFAALMTLYESNYARLRWLVEDWGNVRETGHVSISQVIDDLDLYLSIVEVNRYTTTINLTYVFREQDDLINDPDLLIRVYHDAKLAEAMECSGVHRHTLLRRFETPAGYELSRRWQRNMMLNKWLEYCLDKGHSFSARTSQFNTAAHS